MSSVLQVHNWSISNLIYKILLLCSGLRILCSSRTSKYADALLEKMCIFIFIASLYWLTTCLINPNQQRSPCPTHQAQQLCIKLSTALQHKHKITPKFRYLAGVPDFICWIFPHQGNTSKHCIFKAKFWLFKIKDISILQVKISSIYFNPDKSLHLWLGSVQHFITPLEKLKMVW